MSQVRNKPSTDNWSYDTNILKAHKCLKRDYKEYHESEEVLQITVSHKSLHCWYWNVTIHKGFENDNLLIYAQVWTAKSEHNYLAVAANHHSHGVDNYVNIKSM